MAVATAGLDGERTFRHGMMIRRAAARAGVFDRFRFEIRPIPQHALGVAYVNYADSLWMLARRTGHYHVAYRAATEPFTVQTARLSQFVNEAILRVGTRRWNSSRWFYFRWDTAEHGESGDHIL